MPLACLLVFMAQMATTVYLPSLPAVMHALHVAQSTAELSISLFVLGAALPIPLWGEAAERFGRQPALRAALLLFTGSSLLLFFNTTAEGLLTLRTLQGVAAGGASIVARIVVRDHWQGDELARRLSILSIAFITALGGGQLAGGLIGAFADWRDGFILMGLSGLLALRLATGIPLHPGRQGQAERSAWQAARFMLSDSGFLGPALAGGMGYATTVTLQELSPFIFQHTYGMGISAFGGLGILLALAYFSGAVTVNRLVGRLGSLRLMQAGAAVMVSGTALMLPAGMAGHGPGLFILLYVLVTFGQAVLFPNSMARAVSAARMHGAHAMALCGFMQQGVAGLAAILAVTLHRGPVWALAVAGFGLLTGLIVLDCSRRARSG